MELHKVIDLIKDKAWNDRSFTVTIDNDGWIFVTSRDSEGSDVKVTDFEDNVDEFINWLKE
jgi:hypothetical protein